MNRSYIFMIAFLTPLISGQGPPPIVDAYSPDELHTVSKFNCDGVKITLEYQLKKEKIEVIRYTSNKIMIDDGEIAKWNYFLRSLRNVDSVQFLCSEYVSTVGFIGESKIPEKDTVQVYIANGIVKPMVVID